MANISITPETAADAIAVLRASAIAYESIHGPEWLNFAAIDAACSWLPLDARQVIADHVSGIVATWQPALHLRCTVRDLQSAADGGIDVRTDKLPRAASPSAWRELVELDLERVAAIAAARA